MKPKNMRWHQYHSKYEKTTGCWEWKGTKDVDGYGRYTCYGAHRLMYESVHGVKLVPQQLVMHSCDNPGCVNPDHLSIGTIQDNHRDMVTKNRHHIPRKLSDQQVLNIRQRQSESSTILAKEFGISGKQIRNIWQRKVWADL